MQFTVSLPRHAKITEKLPFGGTRPDGTTVAVNGRYLTLNGRPFFPVTGEFHYARYRREDWERELCKMKAGGVTVVASYIFWIHHEEEEGVFDFSGQRDLRYFLKLCAKNGLLVLLRVGPWCHGECRNGGFPDWIEFSTEFPSRCDHPRYLYYVRRFFTELGRQTDGFLWEQNGPIIGIQLENEYRAYAEPDHAARHAHMHTLRRMATECGLRAPLITATAWGTATLNEMEELPVMGAYADAAWAGTLDELKESAVFLFRRPKNDLDIGSDLSDDTCGGCEFDIDMRRYPYLTAELGGGMQVTLHRRVLIDAKDTEALAVCMMGSGSAMLGYYMYHGGTNPDGRLSTMEESEAVGAPNTLPIKSYDFQAILRENGDVHESYHLTRRHHLFLHTFGHLVAPAETVIPPESPTDPADLTSVRFALRHNAAIGGGFLFINNHMRRRRMEAHTALTFALQNGSDTLTLPPIDLACDDIRILPYRIPLTDRALLECSNATPLCVLGERWFFYTDEKPVYRFVPGSEVPEIITLTEEESRRAYLISDALYIADCALYERNGEVYAEYEKDTDVTVYRATGPAEHYRLHTDAVSGECHLTERTWRTAYVDLSYPKDDAEPIVTLDYRGDRVEIYDARDPRRLIADWFTNGLPLRLNMMQYGCPSALLVQIYPSLSNRYFDRKIEPGCRLLSATMSLRYVRPFSEAEKL